MVPEWLDKTFLQAAIQGGEDKEPKVFVENFSVGQAVSAGENYTSQILRVIVTYRTEETGEQSISLIIKAPYSQFPNLDREPMMYNRVLQRIEDKIKCEFSARSYYSKQNNILVLSDLKMMGYVVCDKFKQLNYAHCLLLLQKLAKFHAASVAVYNENPEELEQLGEEPLYSEGCMFANIMKPIVGVSLKTIIDVLNRVEENESLIQFLQSRKEGLFKSLEAICKPKERGLNVLNHGDLWINNMLFKHSESGDVLDVKFIDYQALRYMTPAIDILYFTWTSADEDVREHRLPRLYDTYIQTLNDSLSQLGCEERYTTEELWADMRAAVDFALATTLFNLPMMLNEPADAPNFSDFDFDQFVVDANNGIFCPRILKVFQGSHFKDRGPKVTKQIYKILQEDVKRSF